MAVSREDAPFARLARMGQAEEVPAGVRLSIGQVFPEWDERSLNLNWRAVKKVVDELSEAAEAVEDEIFSQAVDGGEAVRMLLEQARRQSPEPPALTILEVFHAFEEMAATTGKGSQARKETLLRELLARATPLEAKYLVKIISQDMRHGVNEGIMLDAIACAGGVKGKWVRRANQFWGDVGEVALVALSKGEAGLKEARVCLFLPIKPMLAQTGQSMSAAFDHFGGRVALEYKLDGARVQIHVRDGQVRIYSRQLSDVTASLPDVSAEVKERVAAHEAILEGEAVAIDTQGRPLPFQHLMRRFRRKRAVATLLEEVPVQLNLFDVLYVNGEALVDQTYQQRWKALQAAAGDLKLVPRLIPKTVAGYYSGHNE
jgi:DNA ligase-1